MNLKRVGATNWPDVGAISPSWSGSSRRCLRLKVVVPLIVNGDKILLAGLLSLPRPCPKSRLGELGTEPVAVATGCFQRDYPIATASGSVPNRLTDTRILSYEAKPLAELREKRVERIFMFLLISVLILIGVALVGAFLYARRRNRQARIAEMLSGDNLLAAWTYDPDEWRRAVEEEYTWVRNKDGSGECYISPSAIYVRNNSQDRLIDLSGNGKVVTHASYRGADPSSPLKLRVRWRVVTRYQDRPDEVKYFKEDYRIPVPIRNRNDAARVADFFTVKLENNLNAYTAVVPDDEPISLFGKDSF
jgi:hypothetical protein